MKSEQTGSLRFHAELYVEHTPETVWSYILLAESPALGRLQATDNRAHI